MQQKPYCVSDTSNVPNANNMNGTRSYGQWKSASHQKVKGTTQLTQLYAADSQCVAKSDTGKCLPQSAIPKNVLNNHLIGLGTMNAPTADKTLDHRLIWQGKFPPPAPFWLKFKIIPVEGAAFGKTGKANLDPLDGHLITSSSLQMKLPALRETSKNNWCEVPQSDDSSSDDEQVDECANVTSPRSVSQKNAGSVSDTSSMCSFGEAQYPEYSGPVRYQNAIGYYMAQHVEHCVNNNVVADYDPYFALTYEASHGKSGTSLDEAVAYYDNEEVLAHYAKSEQEVFSPLYFSWAVGEPHEAFPILHFNNGEMRTGTSHISIKFASRDQAIVHRKDTVVKTVDTEGNMRDIQDCDLQANLIVTYVLLSEPDAQKVRQCSKRQTYWKMHKQVEKNLSRKTLPIEYQGELPLIKSWAIARYTPAKRDWLYLSNPLDGGDAITEIYSQVGEECLMGGMSSKWNRLMLPHQFFKKSTGIKMYIAGVYTPQPHSTIPSGVINPEHFNGNKLKHTVVLDKRLKKYQMCVTLYHVVWETIDFS